MNEKTFAAKKSLGQNFLHAPQIVSLMVHRAEIKPGDTVLEVGPGKGALTQKLLEAGAQVVAVEKDDRAIPFLSEKFPDHISSGQLKLVHTDILEYTPEFSEYTIVANIPYYISGEFLQKFLEKEKPPKKIVVMLQKELAKRIVDEKGSILGMSVKAYGNPVYLTSVPRKFFRPIPNVDSAVLLIENISKKFFTEAQISEKTFFDIIKTGFAHKRKVLIKNLEEKIGSADIKNLWEKENFSPKVRAEELTLADWKKIVIFAERFPQKNG
jgi:16S rRNA (adenine1518-N6/adenine1519-N6)-dimethyltransferase